MNQQYVCLLSGVFNEPLFEVFCFLGCGVFFFFNFTTTTWIYKTKVIKNKGY